MDKCFLKRVSLCFLATLNWSVSLLLAKQDLSSRFCQTVLSDKGPGLIRERSFASGTLTHVVNSEQLQLCSPDHGPRCHSILKSNRARREPEWTRTEKPGRL